MAKAKTTSPLPLPDVLRDLAVLRASDVDLDSLVPKAGEGQDAVVESSYEFVREAREALGMHNRGKADIQGERVERVRSSLEELLDVCIGTSGATM
jgi:hypothetical protein